MKADNVVFALCAVTSALCAAMLWRGFASSGARLLKWGSLCFAGLALNNILLVVDVRFLPQVDLLLIRQIPALAGLACLIYGLVWDRGRR